jgi:2'-5' RNA ligase
MEPITGIAVPIRLPPRLARLRRRWDYAAGVGAGSHVTALYPFMPVADLTPDVRRELAAIAALVAPFEVRFARAQRWDTVVWLAPEPAEPFRALTEAISARWPAYPPYGGVHDVVIPHLTVTESDDAPLEAIAAAAAADLPFTARARALELWRQDESERWHPHWRMPLGDRG